MSSRSSLVTLLVASAVALIGCSAASSDAGSGEDEGASTSARPDQPLCPTNDAPFDPRAIIAHLANFPGRVINAATMTPRVWSGGRSGGAWSPLTLKSVESAGTNLSLSKLYTYFESDGQALTLVFTTAKEDSLKYTDSGALDFTNAPGALVLGECPIADDGSFTCSMSVTSRPTANFPINYLPCSEAANYVDGALSLHCQSGSEDARAAVVEGQITGYGCVGFSTILKTPTGSQLLMSAHQDLSTI